MAAEIACGNALRIMSDLYDCCVHGNYTKAPFEPRGQKKIVFGSLKVKGFVHAQVILDFHQTLFLIYLHVCMLYGTPAPMLALLAAINAGKAIHHQSAAFP